MAVDAERRKEKLVSKWQECGSRQTLHQLISRPKSGGKIVPKTLPILLLRQWTLILGRWF